MKSCLGLIILLFSTLAFSGPKASGSKSSSLFLRGRVPASTSIVWDKADPSNNPQIKFNGGKSKPKIEINTEKDHKKITISHP